MEKKEENGRERGLREKSCEKGDVGLEVGMAPKIFRHTKHTLLRLSLLTYQKLSTHLLHGSLNCKLLKHIKLFINLHKLMFA